MSLFERITTLTKAAIHEGLNKLEDPVLLTGQYLRDLEQEIADAERNEHDLKVAANVLERRKQEYQLQAARSENEALQMMEQGNDNGTRLAVLAKLKYLDNIQECEAGLEETKHALSTLVASIQRAKEERSRLKAKRAELTARARQAAATINSASQGSRGQGSFAGSYAQSLNAGTASRGFERMEEKITEWEVMAETSNQGFLAPSSPTADPNLNQAVEAELDRLRSKKSDTKN